MVEDSILELHENEQLDSQALKVGWIGWGSLGQSMQQYHQQQRLASTIEAWVHPLEFSSIQLEHWSVEWELEALFKKAQWIIVDASEKQWQMLLPQIRLMITDSHTLIVLGNPLGFDNLQQQLNQRHVIHCAGHFESPFQKIQLLYHLSPSITMATQQQLKSLFNGVARLYEVQEESQLTALQQLLNSLPSMAYTLLDAMGDGLWSSGVPKAFGVQLIANHFAEAMDTLLNTNHSLAELREQHHHAGAIALERQGIRQQLILAMEQLLPSTERN